MFEFIESIAGGENLDFKYEEYDLLFVRNNHNSYYLFFFLKCQEQLVSLQKETANIFQAIKEKGKIYQPDMDKNITCIFLLCVSEDKYYEIGTNRISDLSKVICLVEEDLNYFKKNVLLYTDKMKEFARENIGKFEELCQEYFTDDNFQLYKISNKDAYEYDFLLNLFIKIPFLNFHKYMWENQKEYHTLSSFIEAQCSLREIDHGYIDVICGLLEENLEDENKLYKWLDMLQENKSDEDKEEQEVLEDEN